MATKSGRMLSCSFCGKNQHEARKLFQSKEEDVLICDACIEYVWEVLCEERRADSASASVGERCLPIPEKIFALLGSYVIGQSRAKMILSIAVYNHYKRLRAHAQQKAGDEVEIAKTNILLIGPTGSGKTLFAQTLARVLDVPLVIADATTLTEAGYVGEDVESILQKLLVKCEYDVEKAQRGIVYIDEIDKIARKPEQSGSTRDVSGEGVQNGLLRLLEGTVVSIPPPKGKQPPKEAAQVDTTNILFICGGAFVGLEKIIRARGEESGIGFSATIHQRDGRGISALLSAVLPDDLVKFGFIPEFVGRLPVIAPLEELTEDALVAILTKPKNALVKQYQKSFAFDDIALEFSEGALRLIAQHALMRKTGARGLHAIMEEVLREAMFETPGKNIEKVLITEAVVTGEEKPCYCYRREQLALAGPSGG